MTEPTEDLQQRCAECIEWQKTGELRQGALRAYAEKHWQGHHDSLQMAERDTAEEAMQWIAKWGTPPAVAQEPVAHDEDLLEQLYWDFDSQRKKTGEERLAFKGKMRSYASEFRRRSVGQMVFAQSVSDDMMNLADRLGDLPYVDPRAWRHLLVYAPPTGSGAADR